MEVRYTTHFFKDIDKIEDKKLKDKISTIIQIIKNSNTIREIDHLKKIKDFKNAYRIKIGNYRIGLFISDNIVEFARFVHRKDIYKYFP